MTTYHKEQSTNAFSPNLSSNIFSGSNSFGFLENKSLFPIMKTSCDFIADNNFDNHKKCLEKIIKTIIEVTTCLQENNIIIENTNSLPKFFLENDINNTDLLKTSIKKIRGSFDDAQIILEYDPDYKRDLNFIIRREKYEENNKLLSLIMKTENIISDILDDNEANFNITIDTDYNKPEINNSEFKQSIRV